MKVLIIKTSSLGDVIHTFPAITDAANVIKDIQFDWLIEKNLQEIPLLHPNITSVIPITLRGLKKNPFQFESLQTLFYAYKTLRQKKYDIIIDAQGLFKSAVLSLFARGNRYSFDKNSSRELLIPFIYTKTFSIAKNMHAVHRIRELFANALGYSYSPQLMSYGFDRSKFRDASSNTNYIVLLHGTTWKNKHWPDSYWCQLAKLITDQGLMIRLVWSDAKELDRVQRIGLTSTNIQIMPKMHFDKLATLIANAKACVAVDTGLGHLSAALSVPTVSLYGPTDPKLTGTLGTNQTHLRGQLACAPCLQRHCCYTGETNIFPACFTDITPEIVWLKLHEKIQLENNALI